MHDLRLNAVCEVTSPRLQDGTLAFPLPGIKTLYRVNGCALLWRSVTVSTYTQAFFLGTYNLSWCLKFRPVHVQAYTQAHIQKCFISSGYTICHDKAGAS